jgi:hypothetical protein
MWLPGYERHEYPGLAGKPYQFTHNPKGCMHTTEGGSIAGAMSAYAPYPPHLIYDWRNRRGVQHVRLDRAAYSAMDGNDDDYMIQVELVGFAAETRTWPEQALRNIAADVVAPLERLFKIPRRIIWHGFKDSRDGVRPYISSAESPIRLNWTQLRDFSGWLGHQHLPSPDTHWDPGALPMARILGFLSEEDDDMPLDAIRDYEALKQMMQRFFAYEARPGGAAATHLNGPTIYEQLSAIRASVAAVADNKDITPAELERVVDAAVAKHTPTPEQVAAAQLPHIQDAVRAVLGEDNADQADQIVDELTRRLSNPTT